MCIFHNRLIDLLVVYSLSGIVITYIFPAVGWKVKWIEGKLLENKVSVAPGKYDNGH